MPSRGRQGPRRRDDATDARVTGPEQSGDATSARVGSPAIEIVWTWATPHLEHRLAADERARYQWFRRQADRDMFATGRALLREVAGARMGVPSREVVLRTTCARCGASDHGAPVVEQIAGAHPAPHVSLTHAHGLVMVAAGDLDPLGIDCEPLDGALVAGFDDVALAPSEQAALADLESRLADPAVSADDRSVLLEARIRTWVRKEAVLKATGQGLTTDPREVVLGRWSDPPQVVSAPGPVPAGGWWVEDVDPMPGFLGAVASAAPGIGRATLDVRQVELGRIDVTGATATHRA